jgi:hypothetical protein
MKKAFLVIAWTAIALCCAGFAVVAYAFGSWLLVAHGVIAPWNIGSFCVTDSSVKSANVGGFDFEFAEMDCDVMAKQPVWLVFVSRHGERQRHPLAAHAAIDEKPTATEVAPRTVQLSLGKIQFFHMKDDRWRDLRVTYDYGMPTESQAPAEGDATTNRKR